MSKCKSFECKEHMARCFLILIVYINGFVEILSYNQYSRNRNVSRDW